MIRTTQILMDAFRRPLPGRKAQLMMSPSVRFTGMEWPDQSKARESSVLILLYFKDGCWHVPLMKRTVYKGAHSGQISLPGGKKEEGDRDHFATAVREAEEEIGIVGADVDYIGELTSLYIPNSNFLVYPQVGLLKYEPVFTPDQREVETIIEIPVTELCDPNNIKRFSRQINHKLVDAPFFSFKSFEIWGATAMIISEFIQVLSCTDASPTAHFYSDCNAPEYQSHNDKVPHPGNSHI